MKYGLFSQWIWLKDINVNYNKSDVLSAIISRPYTELLCNLSKHIVTYMTICWRMYYIQHQQTSSRGRRGRDRMVVGFTTTYAIGAYHHWSCVAFDFRSVEMYSIQHYVIKFVSDFVAGCWFSSGTTVSSTNNTDRHDITEIVLQRALNNINQTSNEIVVFLSHTYLLMLSTEIHHIANYLHNK